MNKFRNILVPVDFSKESKNALDSALSLARETNARLTVLHVFDKPPRSTGKPLWSFLPQCMA